MMWLRTIGWLWSPDGCPALPPHPVPGTPWAQGTLFPGAVLGLSRLRSGHGNGWGLSPEKAQAAANRPISAAVTQLVDGFTATQPTVLAPQWARGDWIPRSQLRIHLEALTRCRPAVLRLRTRSAAELRVARPSPRPSFYRQERAGAAAGPARRGGSGALRALARPVWPRASAWHLARV